MACHTLLGRNRAQQATTTTRNDAARRDVTRGHGKASEKRGRFLPLVVVLIAWC
jgi:hypothetical protein